MLKYVLILIIVCEIIGMASSSIRSFVKSLMYYTQLSNVAGLLSAAALLVFGPAEWVKTFRYLACCMLVMTMLVTIFVLVPTMKDTKLLLWSRVGFIVIHYLHNESVFGCIGREETAKAQQFILVSVGVLLACILLCGSGLSRNSHQFGVRIFAGTVAFAVSPILFVRNNALAIDNRVKHCSYSLCNIFGEELFVNDFCGELLYYFSVVQYCLNQSWLHLSSTVCNGVVERNHVYGSHLHSQSHCH